MQLSKGDKVFGLSPDFIFTSKWGVLQLIMSVRPANCRSLHNNYQNCYAGTYAEFATIKSNLLAAIPDNISFDQAAAVPLVCLTAMQVHCDSTILPGSSDVANQTARTCIMLAVTYAYHFTAGA